MARPRGLVRPAEHRLAGERRDADESGVGVSEAMGADWALAGGSELPTEFVGIEVGVAEDAPRRAALELAVERHDEERAALGVPQAG